MAPILRSTPPVPTLPWDSQSIPHRRGDSISTFYDDSVEGHITRDDDGNVTHIGHSQELRASEENRPLEAAIAYVKELAGLLRLDERHLDNLHVRAQAIEPQEKGAEFRLQDEKMLFDGTTVSFAQTYFDVPVFRRGIAVKIKHGA